MEKFAFLLGSDMHQSPPERGIFLRIGNTGNIGNIGQFCFKWGVMLVLYFMLFVLS